MIAALLLGLQKASYPDLPATRPEPRAVESAAAATPDAMQPYREPIPGSGAAFDLVPIRGGAFRMGAGARPEEGPVHDVEVGAFWMGKTEVTWDEYRVFQDRLDQELRKEAAPQDAWADAVSRPTPPYRPMDFGMGVEGFPAVGMTQFAAKQYTKWLSMKTGRFYRLPTEAEWEYACRAGTTTAYSFGDDASALDEHAWHVGNSGDAYHRVATKRPNPWGLFDMHGNVAEWTLDRLDAGFYATLLPGPAVDPIAWPTELYPRVVRGGSWDDDAERLRSSARTPSRAAWKAQDPQMPKSIWYHTNASFVGFRVVRPLVEPPYEEWGRWFDADLEEIRAVEAKQRAGGR